MKPLTRNIQHTRLLNTGIVAWIILVTSRSFFIWFDWETVRFFVQPRPGQYRWLSAWWSGWVDLSDYGIEAASLTLRPLMTWSFQLESLLFGSRAPGYHLLSITAHICCVFLLMTFLKNHCLTTAAATVFGLLFALHPLSTQPLWILGDRGEVFVLLGGLLALNGYPRKQWLVLTGLFIALYSKETAISIPVWLAAYDLLFLDRHTRFVTSVKSLKSLKNLKNRFNRLFPAAALTVFYLVHRTIVFSGAGGYRSVDHLNYTHFFDVFSQNIAWLLTVPHRNRILTLAAVATILLLTILSRSRLAVFGIVWFVVFLLPTHNLSNKWYLYTALAAFITVIAGICQPVLTSRHFQKPLFVCMFAFIIWMSFTSYAELHHQKRNADVPVFLAEQLKQLKPNLPPETDIHFVLPAHLDPYRLNGHYFDPNVFQVKADKTPIESIVWDLNATRYLRDMTPIWTRSVEPAVRLVYNDISLRVVLTRNTGSGNDGVVRIFYDPGHGLELIHD